MPWHRLVWYLKMGDAKGCQPKQKWRYFARCGTRIEIPYYPSNCNFKRDNKVFKLLDDNPIVRQTQIIGVSVIDVPSFMGW